MRKPGGSTKLAKWVVKLTPPEFSAASCGSDFPSAAAIWGGMKDGTYLDAFLPPASEYMVRASPVGNFSGLRKNVRGVGVVKRPIGGCT